MEMVKRCENKELKMLCEDVRKLCLEKDFKNCLVKISKAMGDFPNDAAPHNLYGIVLEMTGNHIDAMKHFRAAWSLDPSYAPTNQNLKTYGNIFALGEAAFDENDIVADKENSNKDMEIVFDERGTKHIIHRAQKKIFSNAITEDKKLCI